MERQDTVKYLSKKCFHGKNVLNPYTGQIMYQPCGECPACLTRKASARSMRLSLQSSISKYTFMIDPTYTQKYVPKYQIFKATKDPNDDVYIFRSVPRKRGNYKIHQKVSWTSKVTGKHYSGVREVDAPLTYDHRVEFTFRATASYIEDFRKKATLNIDGKFPRLNDYYGYICHNDVILFMKRVRKKIFKLLGNYEKIHTYVVSEYGPVHFRPHFHIILCTDSDEVAKNIGKIVRSCWPFGDCPWFRSDGGAESYVARYVNSFTRLPYHLRQNDEVKPRGRFSNGFTKEYFSDALQAVRDSISGPKEAAPFFPFFNGVPTVINGKLLSIRPPRSCVDSCFLRYASNGRLSEHELYWLVRSVLITLSKSTRWLNERYGPGRKTLMDIARFHVKAMFHNSVFSTEKYLAIENSAYICYEWARLETPTSEMARTEIGFKRDVDRLYRLFSTVTCFTTFWNLTENTPYDYFIKVIGLSRYYYDRFAQFNLRSQYTELSSLVDLDEELALFSVMPVIEDHDDNAADPFKNMISRHSVCVDAELLAFQRSEDAIKHREINDMNIKFVKPDYNVLS